MASSFQPNNPNQQQADDLLATQKLLRATLDSSTDMIQVFEAVRNQQGDIIDFTWILNNHAAEKSYDDVVGQSLLQRQPGVVEEGIFEAFKQVVETGLPQQYEKHYVHEQFDGWFHQSVVRLNDGVATTTTDITGRKNAEAEILRLKDEIAQKATDKYYTIFNSIDEGFLIHEMIRDEAGRATDFRLIEVNPAFTRQTGLGADTVGKRASEFLPNLEQFWIDTYDRVARSGIPERVENYNQATARWYNVHVSRVGGQDRQVAILFEDMTERKQRETSREMLISIAQDFGQLTDETEIIRSVGTRLAAHLGITCYHYVDIDENRDQVTVRHFWHALEVPPILGTYPLRAFVSPEALADWRAGKPTIIHDMERDVPDGTPEAAVLKAGAAAQQISACIAVGLSQKGKWKAYFALADSRPRAWTAAEIELVQEVAGQLLPRIERARAEEALHESQKRFESIANLVPDLLWYSQPDGATNWYNQRWLEYTGQRFEEAIGWGWTDAIHPNDRAASAQRYGQAVKTGESLRQEHRIRRHDGEYRWFGVSATPLKDKTGQVIRMYGAATDIHESKRLEATLREADRRKDEFLAMLAHELRNPLSTIRSGLQILNLTDGVDQATTDTLAMMHRQTDHLVRMVDDLLDVSRISQGKIELKKQWVNLVELVRQAAQTVAGLYQEQGRRLQVALPAAPIELEGDATRLSQVVINLLTNGVRYTREGGTVWLRLTHQDGRSAASPTRGEQAIIQVQDDGIGLADNQLAAIFELFVQADNSVARAKGGLGIGLTLVKRLVELHGGRIEAASPGLGRGSTFTVSLPTLNTAPSPGAGGNEPAVAPTLASCLLVIDDNTDAAFTLSMLLKLKGYKVHTRNSGRQGLEAAEELRPRVILCDIGMPEMDGYAVCRAIRQQQWGQSMILIALTGYGGADDKQLTREAGFDGHLTKPVELNALLASLADLLPRS